MKNPTINDSENLTDLKSEIISYQMNIIDKKMSKDSYSLFLFNNEEIVKNIHNNPKTVPVINAQLNDIQSLFKEATFKNVVFFIWYEVFPSSKTLFIETMATNPINVKSGIAEKIIRLLLKHYNLNKVDYGITTGRGESLAKKLTNKGIKRTFGIVNFADREAIKSGQITKKVWLEEAAKYHKKVNPMKKETLSSIDKYRAFADKNKNTFFHGSVFDIKESRPGFKELWVCLDKPYIELSNFAHEGRYVVGEVKDSKVKGLKKKQKIRVKLYFSLGGILVEDLLVEGQVTSDDPLIKKKISKKASAKKVTKKSKDDKSFAFVFNVEVEGDFPTEIKEYLILAEAGEVTHKIDQVKKGKKYIYTTTVFLPIAYYDKKSAVHTYHKFMNQFKKSFKIY